MDPVIVQVSAFTVMFVAGMTLGLMFDLYRLLRAVVHPRGILDGLFDLLFWCCVAPIMILFIFYGNWGELRVYVFVAIILGALFYFKTLGDPIRMIMRKAFRILGLTARAAARGAEKGLIAPLLWIWDYGVTVADRLAERRERREAAAEGPPGGPEGDPGKPAGKGKSRNPRPKRVSNKGSS